MTHVGGEPQPGAVPIGASGFGGPLAGAAAGTERYSAEREGLTGRAEHAVGMRTGEELERDRELQRQREREGAGGAGAPLAAGATGAGLGATGAAPGAQPVRREGLAERAERAVGMEPR